MPVPWVQRAERAERAIIAAVGRAPTYAELWSDHAAVTVDSRFIRSKQAANRPKDQRVLLTLHDLLAQADGP